MPFFSSSSQVVHWSAEIHKKVYDPRKEGRSDRPIDQASEVPRILQNGRKNHVLFLNLIPNNDYDTYDQR